MEAVRRLQRWWQRQIDIKYLSRMRAACMLYRRALRTADTSAAIIAKTYRRWKLYRAVVHTLALALEYRRRARRVRAATNIQRVVRGHFGRREAKRHMWAIVKLQRQWRFVLFRKLRLISAVMIQRWYVKCIFIVVLNAAPPTVSCYFCLLLLLLLLLP